MKEIRKQMSYCKEYGFFFLLFFILDGIYVFFLWLIDIKIFYALSIINFLFTFGSLFVIVYWINKKEEKREQVILDFLQELNMGFDISNNSLLSDKEKRYLNAVKEIFLKQQKDINNKEVTLEEYKEYIETWVHEIKTPLSLITLILDNREDEMSPLVSQKINYANSQTQNYVNQILYYSKLKAVHKDYILEQVCLEKCCEDVLYELQSFLEEQNIQVEISLKESLVVTDRKGISFIIQQIINNAIKYMNPNKEVKKISFLSKINEEETAIILKIKDNGVGVKKSDLPFLFDKGFIGDTMELKKKSTGMGLYLVNETAKCLKIEIEVESVWEEGFEIILKFPIV